MCLVVFKVFNIIPNNRKVDENDSQYVLRISTQTVAVIHV